MSDHRARLFRATLVIGIGLMAAVDEIIFHQLLAWHHFYDRSTPTVALFTDGLLHAAELVAVVSGFFLYADVRRDGPIDRRAAWSGLLIGAGGFQLFDGLIDHKVLRVHQVRYGVDNLLMYDLAWNAAGVALLLIGLWLWRGRDRTARTQ
ncbi:DUF2243 domain-containing protein [Lysobacter korlensis]|uniref:DUF2243 domain-containing protein n=1 Tax=Lysobacter korlensis TaxID=553636 RepID=A0ABV6RID7_9GAMM